MKTTSLDWKKRSRLFFVLFSLQPSQMVRLCVQRGAKILRKSSTLSRVHQRYSRQTDQIAMTAERRSELIIEMLRYYVKKFKGMK